MIAVRQTYTSPLTKKELFAWHTMLFSDIHFNKDLEIGQWRTPKEPMHIVSGAAGHERVHYVAPPSEQMDSEMKQFIAWFNETDPTRSKQSKQKQTILPGPVRAAIAHLYFECIHPFDDGNGRIGRALVEKALAQELQKPVLFSLSTMIHKHKKEYYDQLSAASSGDLDITEWIEYFVKTIYAAVLDSQEAIKEEVRQAFFWKQHGDALNERQKKVIARMFKEGKEGFKGGLSAQKYMKIAHCSKSTATRDLAELLHLGCIYQLPGSGRSTRYEIVGGQVSVQ